MYKRAKWLVMVLGLTPLLMAPSCPTRTFYVDPVNGNDANSGTATNAAWKTIPGTRTADDTNFQTSGYGPSGTTVSTTNKVQCDDWIFLKPGTTHDSSNGGAIRIDSTYYSECGASFPIVVRTADSTEWSGASGHFTIDATDMEDTGTTYAGSTQGIVVVENLGGVYVGGKTHANEMHIIEVGDNDSALTVNADPGEPQRRSLNIVGYVDTDGGTHGFSTTNQNYLTVLGLHTNNSGGAGIQSGYNVDHELRDAWFNDFIVENCGLTTQSAFERADCIFGTALNKTWFENGIIRHGGMRGVNLGEICAPPEVACDNNPPGEGTGGYNGDGFAHFRDVVIYDMGRRCAVTVIDEVPQQDCVNGSGCVACAGAGIEVSGTQNGDQLHRWVFLRTLLYQNADSGFGGYEDSNPECIHCTLFGNGYWDPNGSDILYDATGLSALVANSITDKRSFGRKAWGYGNAGNGIEHAEPFSIGSVYRATTLSDDFSAFNYCSGWDGNQRSYTQAQSNGHCFSTDDTIQSAAIGFTDISGDCDVDGNTDVSDCDFTLQEGSVAVDHGECAFVTTNSGTNSTGPINVVDNAVLWGDPRLYFKFKSPLSHRFAEGEVIRIGADSRKTYSATATSLTTCDVATANCTAPSAMTWEEGECVHWPYNGAAPDAGAFESN